METALAWGRVDGENCIPLGGQGRAQRDPRDDGSVPAGAALHARPRSQVRRAAGQRPPGELTATSGHPPSALRARAAGVSNHEGAPRGSPQLPTRSRKPTILRDAAFGCLQDEVEGWKRRATERRDEARLAHSHGISEAWMTPGTPWLPTERMARSTSFRPKRCVVISSRGKRFEAICSRASSQAR